MNIRRSWLFFLVMLLLAIGCVALLAEKPIKESWNTLQGVSDSSEWQAVGSNGGKIGAAAGWQNDKLALRYFTTDGALLSEQKVTMPAELDGGTVTQLLPVRENYVYLGLYGPNAEKLYLYRIPESGEAERLIAVPCAGASFMERTSRTALSEFLYEDGVLSFAVCTDGVPESYCCRETGGLEAVETEGTGTDALSVLSMQNGTLLLGGTGRLALGSRQADALVKGQAVTHLTQGMGGWYYIDAVRLDVCYVDAALGASYRLFRLETEWNGTVRNVTSAALTRGESVIMLLDGTVLTLTSAEGTRELKGILQPTALRSWLSLAKYAAFALLAAIVLWLLLCGLRRGYASMVVFRGSLFVAAALLCFTALHFGWLSPMLQSVGMRENEAVVSGVLNTVHAQDRMTDESLISDLCMMLEGTGEENGRNVRAVFAELTDGEWKSNDGRNAATLVGFSPALADAALETGTAGRLQNGVFRYVLAAETRCISVQIEDVYAPDDTSLSRPILVSYAVLAVLALLILLSIGGDLHRISKRMERISRGDIPGRLNLRTGDELESMASIVNSLGVSMQEQDAAREEVEHSYRRFVPEKVLALLGKQSIREVDKSAFAARRMAVMTVWFSFPDTLYTDMNNSRLLFDSVNEVIERTASIVARKGGTVFHFAYNGFDVVMEEDGEAISTAVAIQQEVLSFNEARVHDRLPSVTLRIALDKGNVMLGIVGDNAQMEPTTISTSLSTVQELIDLCNRLKAGILCTEAIISERQDYGNRYMGKCIVGDRPVRVYEVFDGDEFNVRRGKAGSMREFSQGVYDLYGGDVTAAKHMFLQLAHTYPLDGGARYYLYLADRLEHDASLPCVLNVDNAVKGEM